MGKRKKKPKNKKKRISGARPAPASRNAPVEEITTAIMHLRGRRAYALAQKLSNDDVVESAQRERLADTAHEAYVRELLDGGHETSAVEHSKAFLKDFPEGCQRWSLSLQCRLGLVGDAAALYSDANWRERLRRELVDPEDLIDFPLEEVAADARSVREAWRLADENRPREARRRLADVGRRSLLVDWRLFVQAYLAAREGHAAEVEAASRRIQPGTPAAGLAELLPACLKRDGKTLEGSELVGQWFTGPMEFSTLAAAFSKAYGSAGMRKAKVPFKTLVQALVQAGRPSAAGVVIASVSQDQRSDQIMELAVEAGFPKRLAVLPVVNEMSPWLRFENLQETLERFSWPPRERAVLLQYMAREFQRWSLSELGDEPWLEEDDLDDEDREIRARVIRWCRESASLWPELRETYGIWRWAERVGCDFRADQAEVKAFPRDPAAWQRLVYRTAAVAKFREAESAIARLERLHGSESRLPEIKAHLVYQRLVHAFDKQQPPRKLHELAASYTGDDIFERVGIAVRLWLRAQGRKEKRQLGEAMNALGAPWLVSFFSDLLSDQGVSEAGLPAAVRRSLQNDPEAVATDFLALSRRPERFTIVDLRPGLIKSLLKALADARCPLDLATECLRELALKDWHDSQNMLYFTGLDLFLAVTGRMLKAGACDAIPSTCALALRAWLYAHGENRYEIQHSMAGKLLKAAAVFANDSKTKALVREVADSVRAPEAVQVGSPSAKVRAESEALWRRQCAIETKRDFFAHRNEGRVSRKPGLSGLPPDLIKRLAEIFQAQGVDGGIDDDDEDEDEEPDEFPPGTRAGRSGAPRIDLSKCYPASELEFENLMNRINLCAHSVRAQDFQTLAHKIQESNLPTNAKERLLRRMERIKNGGVL